jgi:CMP/dCMP kinase
MPMNDVIFEEQSNIIRQIAQNQNAIIVGRCSDYILKYTPNCKNIFIHAPYEYRVENIQERFNILEKESVTKIKKIYKQRNKYYNFYTKRKWSSIDNYHLSFDSNVFGVGHTVDILQKMFEVMNF